MKFLDTESDIKGYAEKIAETIVIRENIDGSSKDTRRSATPDESHMIAGIVSGALLSVKWGSAERDINQHNSALQQAADTAEAIAHSFLPDANCYDTIYRPIKDFSWQEEIVQNVDFASRKENQRCSKFIAKTIQECSAPEKYGVHFDADAAVQNLLHAFPAERLAQVIAHQVIPSQNYIDNSNFVDGRYSKRVVEWAEESIANDENHNFKNFEYCSCNAHPVLINSLAEKFIDAQLELLFSKDSLKKPSAIKAIENIKSEQKLAQADKSAPVQEKKASQELE